MRRLTTKTPKASEAIGKQRDAGNNPADETPEKPAEAEPVSPVGDSHLIAAQKGYGCPMMNPPPLRTTAALPLGFIEIWFPLSQSIEVSRILGDNIRKGLEQATQVFQSRRAELQTRSLG